MIKLSEEEQIGKLMKEYYNSIPKGRALAEYRFYLRQELSNLNYALSFDNREDMLKRKEGIESILKQIDIQLEKRKNELKSRRNR